MGPKAPTKHGEIEHGALIIPAGLPNAKLKARETVRLGGTVLVVDDRPDMRFLAQAFLEQAGARVITANDGREAVDRLVELKTAGRCPEVVLMDMQMPVMDGYAAVAEIRRLGLTVPVIALTANAMSDDRAECLAAGCTGFLSKPLDKAKLLKAVARHAPLKTGAGSTHAGPFDSAFFAVQ